MPTEAAESDGVGVLTAVVFLLILTISVVIHELAHYFNARMVGVPVRAFSVGMGPVLWRKMWRGTEWRLSLLPLGGYVDLPGLAAETDDDGNLHHPTEGLAVKSLPAKLWVLVGGVIANYIFAVLLLAAVFTLEPSYRGLLIGVNLNESGAAFQAVSPDSPAEGLGILPGDIIREINGIVNPNPSEVRQQIQTASELNLLLERNVGVVTVSTPWPPADAGNPPMLGVALAPLSVDRVGYGQALLEATSFSARMLPETVGGFFRSVGSAFTGQRSEEVMGPVGIVSTVGQATRAGIVPVLMIAALINMSLAVFNLLPIPGLDGGRMLLATIIAIRGRPFKPGQEEFIHFLGFVFIIAFVLLVTFGEVGELITRQ